MNYPLDFIFWQSRAYCYFHLCGGGIKKQY